MAVDRKVILKVDFYLFCSILKYCVRANNEDLPLRKVFLCENYIIYFCERIQKNSERFSIAF